MPSDKKKLVYSFCFTHILKGCPTCRTKFNLINTIKDFYNPTSILYQLDVQDKLAPKDDGTLDLSAIPPDDYEDDTVDEEGYENCVICATNERPQEQVICDGCTRTFHVSCLGIAHLPFCDWFCPTCEIDGESMLFSTFSGNSINQRQPTRRRQPPRRRRANTTTTSSMIPSLSTSPLPPMSNPSNNNNVTETPMATSSATPQLSPEEIQAWEMLEYAKNDSEMMDHSESAVATSSGSPKFKRPTRRFSQHDNHGHSEYDTTTTNERPTFMQSLLKDIRTTPSGISIVNEPPKRNPKTQLSLEKKEKVQDLVREALRPVYRSGKIDKDEYTRINKTVSRSLYSMVINEKDKDFSKYKPVVQSHVNVELAKRLSRIS